MVLAFFGVFGQDLAIYGDGGRAGGEDLVGCGGGGG